MITECELCGNEDKLGCEVCGTCESCVDMCFECELCVDCCTCNYDDDDNFIDDDEVTF